MENTAPAPTTIQHEQPFEDFPPLVTRIKSIIIDQAFIFICIALLSQFLPDKSDEHTDTLKGVLLIALFFVYEPFSMAFCGCTIGNLIMGIRVRRFRDWQQRVNIFGAYIRFIVKILLGWISFLTVSSSNSRRAIHDLASDTIMLYAAQAKDENRLVRSSS